MKYVKKVDDSFNLKNLFNEHISKFNLKNEQELAYFDDVRNFIEKKSQLELQYSQALSKLCNQYTSKEEYQINNESTSEIYIPEKWKLILEEYAYIAEKKQVSSRSILMHCEYFKKIKDQKFLVNQMAVNYLKKNQDILIESHRHNQNAFKTFCIDQFLCNQLDLKTSLSSQNLDKKLKSKKINVTKFKKAMEDMKKIDGLNAKERLKKLDFSKLNYVTTNCCQNQQLQYYFSMEIPQLLHFQNSYLDAFIDESLNTLVLKEVESSKFLVRHFEDSILNAFNINSENPSERSNVQKNSSEGYFIDRNECFSNLIQYDLQPHDTEFQPSFFSFQKDNIKNLSDDYVKWSSKLNDLENLMTAMLTKVNEKRIENAEKKATSIQQTTNNDFVVDQKQEEIRFLIVEKKLQMIHLQAKIDALGSFNSKFRIYDSNFIPCISRLQITEQIKFYNIVSNNNLDSISNKITGYKFETPDLYYVNLNDLDSYNNLNRYEEKREILEANLHQNLELWDQLMKSVDDICYSDESYDYDYVRKTSKDFSQSEESNDSKISFSIFEPIVIENKKSFFSDIPNVEAKYAKTIKSYFSNDPNYISFENNQSLIIYDEVFNGVYRAKTYTGQVGLVGEKFIEFYTDPEIYVKSVYVYDGLDDQELSFPPDIYIRLLRKHSDNKKIDNEEWWEGVYEDKIGFFPSIFVQEIETNNFYENEPIPSPIVRNQNNEQIKSSFSPENQKVPQ
ncbi:unnamed protein product [Brachionus calyciflorus]|uniref:SH3 domain-containing protein n=1 Tax=Brachionus calyciflorus TaxID=104777 RepID=A0A813M1L1_9BILA|nr:unnamed protein product [Brachionus calyciflorus]